MVAAFRQIFLEAGGSVPDRNIERLLRDTHIPVAPDDQRRLDLIIPGLSVARGLPLFCDVTIISPVSRNGEPRTGTSNIGGNLLRFAEFANNRIYRPVLDSGLRALYCLGFETFGRWSKQTTELLPLLAYERAHGLHPQIRRGCALAFLTRWTGIISVALHKAVANAALRTTGADLPTKPREPIALLADLPV